MNRRLMRRSVLAFSPFNTPGILFNAPDGEEGAGGGGSSVPPAPPAWTPPATQEDLDRIITERLNRERAKYADYDELKSKAAERDSAIDAAKTEQERAVDAARKDGESAATQRANALLVKAEARALAAEANFRTPADAVAFVDLASIKVTESGEVDGAALKAALATLAGEKPYLLADDKAPKPKPDPSQGARDGKQGTGVSAGRDMFIGNKK